MNIAQRLILAAFVLLLASCGKVYHVSPRGDDQAIGSQKVPFRTISRAAQVAMPGDEIVVHEGIYRERVTPPRGGSSDKKRIVYRSAEEGQVHIKGSEIVEGWEAIGGGVWKAGIPNAFFGTHNPFETHVAGDWLVDGHWCHTGEVYLNGKSMYEVRDLQEVIEARVHERSLDKEAARYTWFARVGREQTTIWANFHAHDPREELVEITVREACFYPDSVGRNYITVDGFEMSQAATQWAPPSAEQVGMIGTHWSRGWVIRNCTLHDTKCSALTLGKDRASGHNGWVAGTSGAEHYTRVVLKALESSGWHMDSIGGHLVENNHIYNCEQTGICGSLGPVGSVIRGNHIHDIWTKRLFFGYEIGAIKLHAPIDVLIEGNHLHHAHKGLWMDWMTQGTRITRNLCHHNEFADLFSEVNHGPYVVDNNIFLSGIQNWSESGAFAHNLLAGPVVLRAVPDRYTPIMEPHSTAMMDTSTISLGDDRWYNNVFVGPMELPSEGAFYGLGAYGEVGLAFPVKAGGNVYYGNAYYLEGERPFLALEGHDPLLRLDQEGDQWILHMVHPPELQEAQATLVSTGLLGKAVRNGQSWTQPDGSLLEVYLDYQGASRDIENPTPGPWEDPGAGEKAHVVWRFR